MLQIFRHYFSCITKIKLLQLLRYFSDYSVKLRLLKCLRSIETQKLHVKIVVFKLQSINLLVTRRVVLLVHCLVRSVPIFSTLFLDDLNYHIEKQHSAAARSNTYKCKLSYVEFPGFFALRQHKNTQHGKQKVFGASHFDAEDILGDVGDQSLREELQSCRHFLIDSEIQKGRHSVFNFAVNNLTAQVIEEKLDRVLDRLKCVAKLNLALGFILKNIEDGKFRYFYAHEVNTLLEQSKILSNKDDMTKLKESLKKTDVIESCTKERSNTKWRYFKLTNLTIFATLL